MLGRQITESESAESRLEPLAPQDVGQLPGGGGERLPVAPHAKIEPPLPVGPEGLSSRFRWPPISLDDL